MIKYTVVIRRDLTSQLQLLVVSVNIPFRALVHEDQEMWKLAVPLMALRLQTP
jgi:hypothetical protein